MQVMLLRWLPQWLYLSLNLPLKWQWSSQAVVPSQLMSMKYQLPARPIRKNQFSFRQYLHLKLLKTQRIFFFMKDLYGLRHKMKTELQTTLWMVN